MLKRHELAAQPFPRATCDALFAAILRDDEADPDLRLPDGIEIEHRESDLIACFRLARQLWIEGFERDAMRDLAARLARGGSLSVEERARFKAVRAKCKHLRYAHVLYGAAHRYPVMLDRLTITMGQVQDAYRTGRRASTTGRSVLLWLLLSRPSAALVRAESDRLTPTSAVAFTGLLRSDTAALEALVAKPTVSGGRFHAARKIVGRQVSFWDTLGTLSPSEERFRLSRWLAAINGAMGAMHDGMVERRTSDAASYDAEFRLPDDIRDPIAALVARIRRSGA
jgi:hypothetical protein